MSISTSRARTERRNYHEDRIMIRLGTLALVVFAAAGTSAFAQTTVTKLTVQNVGAAIEAAGHSYTTSTAEDGTPVIQIDTSGSKAEQLEVAFFECDAKGGCEDAMIWSWYSLPQRVTADKINDWNANGRWTRAYIDSDKDPRLEMDINATGGIGTEAVAILVNTFFGQDSEFATHLGL
jgi:hypothetical protein